MGHVRARQRGEEPRGLGRRTGSLALSYLDAFTALAARGRRARVRKRAVIPGKIVRTLAGICPVFVHPANSAVLTRLHSVAHVEVLAELAKVAGLAVAGVLLVALEDANPVVLARNGRAEVHL